MRALKFLSFFLAVSVLLIGSIFLLNRDIFVSVYQNRAAIAEGSEWVEKTYSLSGLVEYIEEHPRYVSVVSYEIDDPENGIYFQPNVKRILGTSSNFFLLVEYARQVSEGSLDPNQPVPVEEVIRYHLPGIENTRNRDAIRSLRENLLSGHDDKARLQDVVSVMIMHNDLASADFLYHFLGPDSIKALVADLGKGRIEPPLPYSGLHISFNPDLHETSADERLSRLLTQQDNELYDEITTTALAFQNDETFRNRVLEHFQNNGLSLSFKEERMMYNAFPKGEPEALTAILEQVVRGTLFSEEASQIIRDNLSWPMNSPAVARHFDYYGALYDNRISILNGLDIGTSTYTKKDRVQAVFFEKLPIGFWMHMSSNHISQDYQKRLIYDPALYEASQTSLTQ